MIKETTNIDTTQAQNQDHEVPDPNIHQTMNCWRQS